jgi:antirestriction protein ArdC
VPGVRDGCSRRERLSPAVARHPHASPGASPKSFSDRSSLHQEITDKIIAELEQGRVPWVQPWGGVTARLGLPRNAATDRPYSGINILILWIACAERGFTAQNWLTFRQALARSCWDSVR